MLEYSSLVVEKAEEMKRLKEIWMGESSQVLWIKKALEIELGKKLSWEAINAILEKDNI